MVSERRISVIKHIREWQRSCGDSFDIEPERFHIRIADAKKRMMNGLRYFCGGKAEWPNGYDGAADWLTDNRGRGLLIIGPCGTGKSLLCTKIIPVLLRCEYPHKMFPIFSAYDLNRRAEEILNAWFVILDDLGLEFPLNDYGNKRMVFSELADRAERKGTVLVLNTNLSLDELTRKYGERTVDRLRAVTKLVMFEGKSMRGQTGE